MFLFFILISIFLSTIVSEVVRVTITAVKQHDSGEVGFGHVVTSFFGPIGTSQPYQSCLVLVLSVEYTGADFYWLFFFWFFFFLNLGFFFMITFATFGHWSWATCGLTVIQMFLTHEICDDRPSNTKPT